MSIIERAKNTKLVNMPLELMKSLTYLAELENRVMQNWEDSKGEILDTRIAQWIKLKLDVIKSLHDMDPNTKREEIEMEKRAELALALAKKQMEMGLAERAELAKSRQSY